MCSAGAQMTFEERSNPERVMGEILEVYREAMERAKERGIDKIIDGKIIGNHGGCCAQDYGATGKRRKS